jgi:hypothetical protein
MSLRDYNIATEIDRKADWGEDFYALVMVLMKNADDVKRHKLISAWPEVWDELEQRYNAPRGLLLGETDAEGFSRTADGLVDPAGEIVRAA